MHTFKVGLSRGMVAALVVSMFASFFVSVLLVHAAGTSFYVRTDGSDTNCDGTADVADLGVPGACAFQTISAAIAAASDGDTINVASGTYAESNNAIVVDKSLTLQGPNAAISPNGGSRVSEAVLTTAGNNISPNTVIEITGAPRTVVIKGFTFTSAASPITSYSIGNTVTVEKNIFTSSNQLGMYFEDPTLSVTDNLFTPGTVAEDTIQVGVASLPRTGSVSFTHNTWSGITGSGALNLSDIAGTISGNTFDGVEYYGVLLAGAPNVMVTGNTFNDISNPNPGGSNTWGAGVRFYDTITSAASSTISGNQFTNSYLGISIKPGADISGGLVTARNNTFSGNTLSGSELNVRNLGTGTLDLSRSYWGSPAGPTSLSLDGSAAFSPWYTDSLGGTLSANPAMVIDSGAASLSNNTAPSFTFHDTVTTNTDTFDCAIDGATTTNCTSPFATSSLSGGVHTFTVKGTATSLLTGYATQTFTIDLTPPTVTSVSYAPTNGILAIGDILTLTINADAAGYTATTSNAIMVNGVAATGFTDNGNGTYTAYYTVGSGNTDRANSDQIPVSVTLTDAAFNSSTFTTAPLAGLTPAIDATAPGAPSTPDLNSNSDSGTSATDNVTKNTTPTFDGTAEVGSTVRLYDGATQIGSYLASGGTWSIISSILSEGVHLIGATATDVVGNTGPTSTPLTVTIDLTAPAVGTPVLAASSDTGISNSDKITTDRTPTITGTGEDGTVTIYDTNGAAIGTGIASGNSWSITSATLTNGSHTITAKNTDAAGNTSATSSPLTITIDRTAPNLSQVTPIPTPSNNTTPSYTFSSSEAGTIQYSGDCLSGTTAAAAGSNTVTFNALTPDATHTNCFIRVTDTAGNQSSGLHVSNFRVDTTSPTVTLSSAVGSLTNAPFTVTATFNESTSDFSLGDITVTNGAKSNFATTSSSVYTFTVTPTADGTVTVQVGAGVAHDAATNPNLSSNTISTTYDHTKPSLTSVSITSSNASTTLAKVGDTITLSFATSETVTTPTVTIDGQAASVSGSGPYTATYTLTGSDAAGVVPFAINYADLATNAGFQTSTTTNASSVTFDRTAPTVTVTTSDADGVVIAGTPVTITATFSEPVMDTPSPTILVSGADTSAQTAMVKVDSTHYTYLYTAGSGNGNAVFTVDSAKDLSGNLQTASSTTLVLDNTAPVITVIGANPDASLTSNFATYTDPGATALDAHDGVVAVSKTGSVSLTTPGTYTLTYTAVDTVGNATSTTRVVVVTLSGNNGQVSGGGGGGGGGGGVGTISTPVPQTTPSTGGQGEVLGEQSYHFTLTLRLGSRGTEVTELQKILIAQGFLKIPAPTGYFGLATQAAVKLYQATYGIPASGLVGPLTRAQLNK